MRCFFCSFLLFAICPVIRSNSNKKGIFFVTQSQGVFYDKAFSSRPPHLSVVLLFRGLMPMSRPPSTSISQIFKSTPILPIWCLLSRKHLECELLWKQCLVPVMPGGCIMCLVSKPAHQCTMCCWYKQHILNLSSKSLCSFHYMSWHCTHLYSLLYSWWQSTAIILNQMLL